ncbi:MULTISPECIES: VanZ family protein [unclassified Streptococcus]|uniref:VanZ family protein n=1 Tax=unclassified Streptococcus TaxID=2608887 RepID=UPI00107200C6|nr:MULTISPECIES: VanZ family protein [unclassified Streptococcus]MBF0787653.1 VanZ family protein [Streptococcus sp. 19428wC2_LYSM12]MCQ9212226.1 VanZ family protein [Streptococcus sp. B01]MCQ9213556.1 VanZ family protein [Streptococcus sp. O1]TFV05375.1 VanZ family protein [Streptococcus sp. LYSM12]
MQSRKMTIFLFGIYFSFLTWIILFKLDVFSTLQMAYYNSMGRSINLIPFAGTAVYNGIMDYKEIGLNVLCFIPFGIYMEVLDKKATWVKNLALMLAVSVAYEAVQYIFGIGVADITDVLANGLGGAIGINIMYILTSIWYEKAYERVNKIALLLTIIVAGLLLLI